MANNLSSGKQSANFLRLEKLLLSLLHRLSTLLGQKHFHAAPVTDADDQSSLFELDDPPPEHGFVRAGDHLCNLPEGHGFILGVKPQDEFLDF